MPPSYVCTCLVQVPCCCKCTWLPLGFLLTYFHTAQIGVQKMVTFEFKILGLDRVNSLLLGLVGFRFFLFYLSWVLCLLIFFLKSTNYGLWLQVHYASTTFWLGSSIPNQSQKISKRMSIYSYTFDFQKCHFHIFSEMIIWIILTLLEKILILTLSRMALLKITLLKVYEQNDRHPQYH